MQAFREKTEKGIRKAKDSYVGHAVYERIKGNQIKKEV